MFGLSMQEKITQVISNTCRNNRDTYLQSLQAAMILNPQLGDVTLSACRNIYLGACSSSVFETFKSMQTSAYSRIVLALNSPQLCGYDDINTDVLAAGSVYAIVYWAVTSKQAQPKDCILLNHMQNDVMTGVLDELDKVEQ